MLSLRLLFVTVCLAYIATLSPIVSASGDDDSRESRGEYRSSGLHEEEDEDKYESHSTLKNVGERNKEKLKKLRKKVAKIVRVKTPSPTQTGTTLPVKKPVTTPVTPQKPTPVTPVTQATSVTKSSTITYRTPEGSDPVLFTVTVKSGVITAASSVTKARNSTSIWYQDSFSSKISSAVVGKKIAGLNLSAVGGASLTTNAFEQFIASSF